MEGRGLYEKVVDKVYFAQVLSDCVSLGNKFRCAHVLLKIDKTLCSQQFKGDFD